MTEQPRILVVDDNETNRDLLVRRLGRRDFLVEEASGGMVALEMIAGGNFDLILLDIMMPDLDGISVLKILRQDFDAVHLPIIMVSARDETDSIVEAINEGANDYITKPVDFPVALARINTHLDMKQAHQALKISEERYALAFRGANDGLWDWDLVTGQTYFSERWKDMMGYGPDEINDDVDSWFDLVHPDEVEGLRQAIQEHLDGETLALIHEYRALHKTQGFRWYLARGVASRDAEETAVRLSGSQSDVTQQKAYDPITGMPNQVLFLDRLERALDKAKRSDDAPCFAVMAINLDRLSEFRNTLGAVKAEEVVLQTSARLRECLKEEMTRHLSDEESVTISRHDEADFAVLVEGCRGEMHILRLAEQCRSAISEPLDIGTDQVVLGSTIGIAACAETPQTTAEQFLRNAITALMRARTDDASHIAVYDENMQSRAFERLRIEGELRRALTDEQFRLHFQPIVDLTDGRIIGCEALVRWQHPERGLVPPLEFITIAEETGLIEQIGDWVLLEACRQTVAWRDAGLPPVEMAVNVSMIQMQGQHLDRRVLEILDDSGLEPGQLKIEITESIFMEDMDHVSSILEALNARGVGIAIDDFGTGYSSLAYLKRLPITHLKIDKSFVDGVSSDLAAQAIVQSTLLMAQSLGIKVICEGIETEEQRQLLAILKAEYGQGYLFAKPLPANDFATMLKESSPAAE